jgi:hypothetical protein
MKRLFLLCCMFTMLFTTNIFMQTTVTCPQGDNYKCHSYRNTDGQTITVWKGFGDVTTTTGPQR